MSFQPLGSKPGEESTKQNAEQNKFSETSFAPVEGKGNTFQDGNFHAEPTNHQSTVEKMLEKRLNRCRNGSKTDSYSTFGVHMRQYNPGFGRCSGDSNSTSFYSDLGSDFDSWDSNMPCSSSQANARDAAKNARERTRNYQDTGYISHAPVLTANELSASIGTFSLEESQPDSSVPIKNLRNDTDDEESGENKKAKMKNPLVKSASTSDLPKLWSERCKSIPETKKYIKCYDVWYSEFYYGHLLADMTVNMTSIEAPGSRSSPVGKFFKKKMPLLFGKSHKSPADVVKNLREALIAVDKVPVDLIDPKEKKQEKALEEVSKNVAMIKSFIYGSDSAEPSSEHIVQVAQLAQEVYNANILPMLVKLLPRFEFECKKDVGQIFNNLLRRQIGTRSPTVEYLGARPEILIQLVQGYSYKDIALTCGSMLRESIRHDHLAKIILYSDVFYTFFTYVQSEVFDIASDAFATFKDLTTRHKAISAEFLDANYDTFFAQYQNLLNSSNYVTRRQSLKLLGELLLDRHNFNIMTKYISNPDNLKLMMELLRDKSRNIQYEAFHVFKVFVANPNKPKPISDILNRNREKLVEFLGEFHNDRTDDEQFNDEKAYLIKQIQEMKSSPKEHKKKKEGDQHGAPQPVIGNE